VGAVIASDSVGVACVTVAVAVAFGVGVACVTVAVALESASLVLPLP
jgi:hypothetical protein